MKVLVVGGGSGGHITPAVAVVRALLEMRPRTVVEFWTDRKYYDNVVKITTEIGVHWGDEKRGSGTKRQYIRVRKIAAGKFHRYAGWKLKDYFENFGITLKDLVWGNICGFCGFAAGIIQAFWRLCRKEGRPDVIFLKGGFVGLPVGLVAQLFQIPYVIHESDAVPGLANRILMKRAKVAALGIEPKLMKVENATTEPSKFVFTGTPVAAEFRPVTKQKQRSLKRAAGFDVDKPLVIVTGGSQGSLHMDEAVREVLPEMLKFTSVGLIAGRKHYENVVDLKKYEEWDKAKLQSNFRLWSFSPAMHELMGAADVVVSRAGATTIAELAALKKAVVLVPFEKLPGGHQVKNAERLEKDGAAMVIMDERMVDQPGLLLESVKSLVRSPKKREAMAENLSKMSKTDAAKQLAEILVKVAGK